MLLFVEMEFPYSYTSLCKQKQYRREGGNLMQRQYLEQRFSMIFTKGQLERISVKYRADKGVLVFADVHGMTCRQASVFIKNIINVARMAFKLVVCHGYTHGHAIKDMLKDSFWNVHIIEEHETPTNPGCTCISVA